MRFSLLLPLVLLLGCERGPVAESPGLMPRQPPLANDPLEYNGDPRRYAYDPARGYNVRVDPFIGLDPLDPR